MNFTPLLTKIVLLFISNVMRRQGHVKYVGGRGELHTSYWWKYLWKEPK
jgi:hypothetical protein